MNTPSQDQQEGNGTWLDLWNLITINLKDEFFHNTIDWLGVIFMSLVMTGGIFRIYNVQFIWKCICQTFPPPLRDLTIRLHVKQLHHKFVQKSLFPHAKLFQEKYPSILLRGRRYYALSSYFFPFLKVASLTFMVQTMVFQAKVLSHCVFKVIQYGYEIFQTVWKMNFNII